jgi:catechol 2,3-dioxygenase-like lactoylglutathione lyase family enzyme
MHLDHCVVAVSDWERSNRFYRDVLGAEIVELEQGRYAYRLGEQQLNVHGPGSTPHPRAADPVRPGNSDLCFRGRDRSTARRSTWPCTESLSRRGPSSGRACSGAAAASTSAIRTGACSS